MATFHQNLVQSFTNFKNKYMRQYDTYEDAVDDIDNIPEGGIFYTNDNASVQDIIDGMTAIHLVGSQIGSGSNNIIFNTESHKRMLIITKKSGVIVGSKEVPTDVLNTDDVISLGDNLPIVLDSSRAVRNGTWPINTARDGEIFQTAEDPSISSRGSSYREGATSASNLTSSNIYGLAVDASRAVGASLTYNGNDSFTITVTDSTLSVYVYVDMLVLGGSASGRNVSFDAAGTNLESTDVEGAIKEIDSKLGTQVALYDGYVNTANTSINLSSSMLNFEYITFICSMPNETNTYRHFSTIPISEIIYAMDSHDKYALYGYDTRYVQIEFVNETRIDIISVVGPDGIVKIIGSTSR